MTDDAASNMYPVVLTSGVVAAFGAIERGEEFDLDAVVVNRSLEGLGVSIRIDFAELDRELGAKKVLWDDFKASQSEISDSARNKFEAVNSEEIYKSLSSLPIAIIDDKDFWRWLIIGPLRWWVFACDSDKDGKLPKESKGLGSASDFRRNPVCRAYFRGRLAADLSKPDISSRYGNAAAARNGGSFADRDFIKSHLLAIQVGNAPFVAGSFIETASDPYLPAGEETAGEMGVRQYVKYFTRLRAEILWTDYSESEANHLGRELRERFDLSSTADADGK